jgi:hypothetical protein
MGSKFAGYAVLDAIEHKFEKAPDLNWWIKPPSVKEELALSRFFASTRDVINAEGKMDRYGWSQLDVAMEEIALLFAGTNIKAGDFDDTITGPEADKPVLSQGVSLDEVKSFLTKLPYATVMEIFDAIGKSVPFWGPAQKPKNPSTDQA